MWTDLREQVLMFFCAPSAGTPAKVSLSGLVRWKDLN